MNQGWHKVTLTNASKFDKESVLGTLVNACPDAFAPVCFVKNNADYTFHVESPKAASMLKSMDKKISVTHNFLLKIKVAPSPPPKHFLDDTIKQKMKTVMGQRFNPESKCLHMKSFHNDKMFIGDSAYVPLARSNVMNNVIRIIGESVIDIEAIDFSENKLPSLENFSMLEDTAPNLKFVDLSNNRLNDSRELEKLKHLKLKVLDLRNNAIESKFKNHEEYVEKVREILPHLEVLDGQNLPKNYSFEEDTNMPPNQKLMSVNDQAKLVLLQFVRQYFEVYDKEDRSDLEAAYHPEAMFSMSATYPANTTAHGTNSLTHYQMDARNLNLVTNPKKRMSFLKRGRSHVVKFINTFPMTQHDLDSFTLDIPVASDNLISVTLTGLFKERLHSPAPLRHFHRNFIIVPQGSGFVITNDSLFVTNPTMLQTKTAFVEEKNVSSPPVLPVLSPEIAQERIAQLCQKTKLRPDWAQKCLEENRWNLDIACVNFELAKNQNKIPPEAYAFLG